MTTKLEDIKLPSKIRVIDIYQSGQLKDFSELRNRRLTHIDFNQYYLFIDDDEKLEFVPSKIDLKDNYYSIMINNFPSNARLFYYRKGDKYRNRVHETLSNNVDGIVDIQVTHPKRSDTKTFLYSEMTNSTYYKIKDLFELKACYILNKREIEKIISEKDYDSMIYILIMKIYYSITLVRNLQYFDEMKWLLSNLNKNLNDSFLNDLINERISSASIIKNQLFFQDKISLVVQTTLM